MERASTLLSAKVNTLDKIVQIVRAEESIHKQLKMRKVKLNYKNDITKNENKWDIETILTCDREVSWKNDGSERYKHETYLRKVNSKLDDCK